MKRKNKDNRYLYNFMNRSISLGNLLGLDIRNNVNMNNTESNKNMYNSSNNVNEISTTVKIGIRNWQNSNLSDLLNFLYRNTGINLQNTIVEGPLIVGYVSNRIQAEQIVKCDGMLFAGSRLRIENMSERVPSTSNTVEFLRSVVLNRYDIQNKMLNLGYLDQDQELIQSGMLSTLSTRSRTFPALIKIASEEPNIIVDSINLANNRLRDINMIANLPKYFPTLKNLCLANNQISRTTDFEIWENKFLNLRELLMLNNPVTKYHGYKNDMLKFFPKLVILDHVIVRDQNKLNSIYNFPIKIQQFFFENNQLGSSAGEFVTNFLNYWDTNRTQLSSLYTIDSQFSIAVDSSIPSSSVKMSDQTPSFGYYIPNSRNITKFSNNNKWHSRLAKGSNEILTLFKKFPKTKHHLQDKPQSYKMEVISFPQINGIFITLHGYFEEIEKPVDTSSSNNNEIGKTSYRTRRYAGSYNNNNNNYSSFNKLGKTNLSKKCFDRIWTLVMVNNTPVIASEMITIRAFSSNTWSSQNTPQLHSSSTINVERASNMLLNNSPPQIGNLSGNDLRLPPNNNLLPQQVDLLKKLHDMTKLNYQYTCMLAEQSNWNYDQAIKNFQVSVNNLPREAFIQ